MIFLDVSPSYTFLPATQTPYSSENVILLGFHFSGHILCLQLTHLLFFYEITLLPQRPYSDIISVISSTHGIFPALTGRLSYPSPLLAPYQDFYCTNCCPLL